LRFENRRSGGITVSPIREREIIQEIIFKGSIEEYGNYTAAVARGWESKSVEAQQAEASEKSSPRRAPMSIEEAARWRERESLRLSRQRVLQQLQATGNPRHRKLLEDTLADLEEKLKRPQTSDLRPSSPGSEV
jgi:hypothetical protein